MIQWAEHGRQPKWETPGEQMAKPTQYFYWFCFAILF
jgi:hypothetical protein